MKLGCGWSRCGMVCGVGVSCVGSRCGMVCGVGVAWCVK